MLIDWVTTRIPLEALSEQARAVLLAWGDRVMRYCPRSGDVRYEIAAWDSVRSDSHQLALRVGTDLWVQGSPARVCGDGDTVFGSGVAAALDLAGCVDRMIGHVAAVVGVELPSFDSWLVSRVDVTGNLALPGLPQVRQALAILRGTEGGRYRVSATSGDTVYHGGRSKLRRGKAYAKGPHLAYLMKQRGYTGRAYTDEEISAANRLLRLEVTLGREWFSRNDWHQVTASDLVQQWDSYYGRMLGEVEVMAQGLIERVHAVHVKGEQISEGRARAALACWHLIQGHGWEAARELHSKTSWYRHMEVLRLAGLGDADISRGEVVSLRRVELHASQVFSWDQLREAA